MEAALRSLLKDTLGDYVQKGLEHTDASSFPLVLRDVELNTKRLNFLNPDDTMELRRGKIGTVKVTPGWMGNIEVAITDVELSFSFSATKAMSNGIKQAMSGSEDPALAAALAASMEDQKKPGVPGAGLPSVATTTAYPCFCAAHNSSEKRLKAIPELKACNHCGTKLWCSYESLQFCPSCSNKQEKCMICGTHGRMEAPRDHKLCSQKRPQRKHMPNDDDLVRQNLFGIKEDVCQGPFGFKGGMTAQPRAPVLADQFHHPDGNCNNGAFFDVLLGMLPTMPNGQFWNGCAHDNCRLNSPSKSPQRMARLEGLEELRIANYEPSVRIPR